MGFDWENIDLVTTNQYYRYQQGYTSQEQRLIHILLARQSQKRVASAPIFNIIFLFALEARESR